MRSLLPVAVAVGVLVVVAGAAVFLWMPQEAPAQEQNVRVVRATTALGFPGATGWTEEPACQEGRTEQAPESCMGEWLHKDSGQRAQVFILPILDDDTLARMTANLRATVIPQGGVVDEVEQNGQQVVRFLQPVQIESAASQEGGAPDPQVSINYLLPAPDNATLHMVTSVVSIESQVRGDERLRDLLAFAAWLDAT